ARSVASVGSGCATGLADGAGRVLVHAVRLAPTRGATQPAPPVHDVNRRPDGALPPCASSAPDALPLILTHGWPGAIVEFLNVIGPLTDPRAHGGDVADAFHVVIPSIPGFGFSGPISESGWSSRRVAAAFAVLMRRLGYQRCGRSGRRSRCDHLSRPGS